MRCLVAGAGGFIGGHLVRRLLNDGHKVRAVDIKPLCNWWQVHKEAANWPDYDLRLLGSCTVSCAGQHRVYNLAADMGGIGFIEKNKAACMLSVLINTHLLKCSAVSKVQRYFYASSACVYHASRQKYTGSGAIPLSPLRESDAYYHGGAMPEDGYGWEKLFSERMCRHFTEDFGLETRVARFHNIYGPHGSWNDGREKAPAALCRKVAEAKLNEHSSIQVWGDGTITRSFCYINDCIDGIVRLTESNHRDPVNVGSSQVVTVNELLRCIEAVARYQVERNYQPSKPQGVAGRNSDNTKIRNTLGWEPDTPLIQGIGKLYPWVEEQVKLES